MTLRILFPLLAFIGIVILAFRRHGRILKRWQFLAVLALFLTLTRVLIPGLTLEMYALFFGLPSALLVGFLANEWLVLERKAKDNASEMESLLQDVALTPEQKATKPTVAIVIPAYNEGENLREILPHAPREALGHSLAYLIVDDGSTDDTAEVIREFGHVYLSPGRNRGGGFALLLGMRAARKLGFPYLLTMDADGQHRYEDIPVLLKPLLENKADVVVGSRLQGENVDPAWIRVLGLHTFNRMISFLVGQKVTDCSNSMRAIRTKILDKIQPIQEKHHTAEFLLEAFGRKVKVTERPITILPRVHGEGKKGANWIYGLRFFKTILISWWRIAKGIW